MDQYMGNQEKAHSRPLHGIPEGILRTNFTEILGTLTMTQAQTGNAKPRCADFQMNAMECLEAYGAKRGRRLCDGYLEDFHECRLATIQMQRVNEMTKERMRQLMRGERTMANYHDKVKPPRDALQFGPFHP